MRSSGFQKGFLILIGLMLAAGCATSRQGDRYMGFGPFFSTEQKDRFVHHEAVGPILSYSGGPGRKEYGIRPLFYYLRNEEEEFEQWEFLYPLGEYRIRKLERYLRFTPFLSSQTDLSKEANRPNDFGMFPIFWGTDKDGLHYGGFFPFYGTFRHKYGKDYTRFVLWPLYSESVEEEVHKTTVLWPIFSHYRGPDHRGIKLWPLFGWEEKKGVFQKGFALWPIIFYRRWDLDTENPGSLFALFPFYVRSVKKASSGTYFPWPFLYYGRDEALGYLRWELPWPFLGGTRSLEEDSFHLWPLFGYKNKLNYRSHFILWPLYKFWEDKDADFRLISYRFLILSRYKEEQSVIKSKSYKLLRIWPIFYYKSFGDGRLRFHFPEIIPIEDEGYDRNWGPILRLFRYERDGEGNEETNLLWGLYHHWQRGQMEQWDLSFLLSLRKDGETSRFSLLKGLFDYQSGPTGRAVRLLYLPWPIEWKKEDKRVGAVRPILTND